MHAAEKLSLEEIRGFVLASEGLRFESESRSQLYGWVELVLRLQDYRRQGKAGRGLLRRYVEKMTGLSRAQVTRLVGRFLASGEVRVTDYRRHRFATRYTAADVELLATVDEAHEALSGPATRRILERELEQYGRPEYARLGTISVAHLYNAWHPAVLQLVAQTVACANRLRKNVSVCGEMAGDRDFTELLLGMGLRSFSMHPSQIVTIKERILSTDAARWASAVERTATSICL